MELPVGPLLAILGYLLGSVSLGLLIAARRGVDLRSFGSGNIGATNVGRALGKPTGRLVLLADLLKGLAPVLAARAVLGVDDPWTGVTGVAAVAGHCYPIWHGLRGGKGAATAAGVLLAAIPVAGVVAALAFLALRKATRRASVGSLGGAVAGAAATAAVEPVGPRALMAASVLVLVFARHADNLGRLFEGTEPPG